MNDDTVTSRVKWQHVKGDARVRMRAEAREARVPVRSKTSGLHRRT